MCLLNNAGLEMVFSMKDSINLLYNQAMGLQRTGGGHLSHTAFQLRLDTN